eukprot:14729064-Ditylum_brightwellii.AAC.1
MGDMPDHFYVYYMATCLLVATDKQDPETLEEGKTMQVRPIDIGNAWQHLFTQAYFDPTISTFIALTKPYQYGCGEPGGGTEPAFCVEAMLDCAEGTMIASVDVENGYNEIM